MFWNVVLMILLVASQAYLTWVLIVGAFAYESHECIHDYLARKRAWKQMNKEIRLRKRQQAQDAAADYLDEKIHDKGGS